MMAEGEIKAHKLFFSVWVLFPPMSCPDQTDHSLLSRQGIVFECKLALSSTLFDAKIAPAPGGYLF